MWKSWVLSTLLLYPAASLEAAPGHVFGMVLYQSDHALPGVTVRLSSGHHRFLRETTTDEKGYFRFRHLPPGIYSLELELSGFGREARRDFDVHLDLALGESVQFTGELPLIASGEVPKRLLRHREFLAALGQGDLDSAHALMRGGVDLSHGQAALGIAVRSGNDAMLRFLLDAGADPNAAAHEKWTALMSATRADAVRALLHAGANVSTRSGDGASLVELAVGREDQGILDQLLAAGAKVDSRGEEGRTPLFHVTGNPVAVAMLLSAGAAIDVRDAWGETPLMRLVRSMSEPTFRPRRSCEGCVDPVSNLLDGRSGSQCGERGGMERSSDRGASMGRGDGTEARSLRSRRPRSSRREGVLAFVPWSPAERARSSGPGARLDAGHLGKSPRTGAVRGRDRPRAQPGGRAVLRVSVPNA